MMEEAGGKGKAASESEQKSLKDKGNEFFKAGNYLKAAALYTQAIKQDPSNPTLYRYHFPRFTLPLPLPNLKMAFSPFCFSLESSVSSLSVVITSTFLM